MYSWEIDQKIKQYDYNIPSSVFLHISNVTYSAQISYIKYDAWSNTFTMGTKDGWNWRFQVYKD